MATHPTADTQVLAGRPFPLGAHPEAGGVRFAVASSVAERVELCLIDDDGNERRIELTGTDVRRVARIGARRHARPEVRLPRPRTVRPHVRHAVQSAQAPRRPVRPSHQRHA